MSKIAESVSGFDVPVPATLPSPPDRQFGLLRSVAAIVRDDDALEHGAWLVLRSGRADRERNFHEFAADPHGARILAGAPSLYDLLTDRDALARLPDGSLGRAYLRFMEDQDISTVSLEAAIAPIEFELLGSEPARHRYHQHTRACHDLWHVLTGYGRDPMGELQLILFSNEQVPSRPFRWIGRLSRLKARLSDPETSALLERAARRGRSCRWLVPVDWSPLLGEPIEWVREVLGIGTPPEARALPPS